jgi:hypothetical protein
VKRGMIYYHWAYCVFVLQSWISHRRIRGLWAGLP